MKKHLLFLITLLITGMTLLGQTSITLTFTGRDQYNAHVRLDNVTIQNLTRGWTEAIFFPDTVYTLMVGTGIDDYVQGNEMQVMPNPFDGKTRLNLYSVKGEPARMVIVDVTGKKCAEYQGNLSQGDNFFEILLTTPQTYILSVQTVDGIHSVKMVNTGRAGANQISLVGGEGNVAKVKISSNRSHIFELGDEMRYTGYSQQSNGLIPSYAITQNQNESEEIVLHFELEESAELPIVATVAASNINSTTAITGGNVFSDGGATITARGVCYSVTPNPTLAENHTNDGTGAGAFISNLTNLIENTTYYVRAYATNSAGTAYGNEVNFTTTCGGFQVSIMGDTTINYGQSTTLVAVGAASYVWNTGDTTAFITVTPNTTTTYMVTGESSTGCFSSTSVTVIVSPILPTVTTSTVTDITYTGAMSGGEVVSDGGANVIMRGVCWSTTPNPTVIDSHTSEGTGIGTFISNLTNLVENTTYYVRAYATNSAGTAYGNEVSFTTTCEGSQVSIIGDTTITYGQSTTLMATGADSYVWNTGETTASITVFPNVTTTYMVTGVNNNGCFSTASVTVVVYAILPTVTTSTVSNISSTTALCGGEVTSGGGADVSARGVCWNTTPNPIVTDNHTVDGTGAGFFTSQLTNLSGNTTYYVRAYATNSIGTAYGNEMSFTTTCEGAQVGIIGDSAIIYGQSTTLMAVGADSYVWNTGETTASITVSPNITTTYMVIGMGSDGCSASASITVIVSPILPSVTTSTVSNISSTTAMCGGEVASDGGADVTARGICWNTTPNPIVTDNHTSDGTGTGIFTSQLTNLLGNTTYYVRAYATNSEGTAYGNEVSFTTTCEGSQVSIIGDTSITYGQSTILIAVGADSYVWSTGETTVFITVAPTSTTTYTVTGVNNNGCFSTASVTVEVSSVLPTVTTSTVSNITSTEASCGGEITSNGGAVVTMRGVCWSTTPNPTVTDNLTVDGSGTGVFTSLLTNLVGNTTYYVRAYAINSVGVGYGNEVSFMTTCEGAQVSITGDTAITYGQSAVLTASGADSYIWSTGETTASITVTPNITTTYIVTGLRSDGCSSSASITILVTPILPTVTTSIASNIVSTTASCGGEVTSDGGANVTMRGVCWSTSPNPTITSNHTTDGTGIGAFTSQLTNLMGNTTYYVRAYATNSIGTAYGNEVSFTTTCEGSQVIILGDTAITYGQSALLIAVGAESYVWSTGETTAYITVTPNSTTTYTVTGASSNGCISSVSVIVEVYPILPTVTTSMVSDIESTTVLCGGEVISDGGATVTARGVCWNTVPNPTIAGDHTSDGTGTGVFTSTVTNLVENTTYYIRAYATNSAGTVYGNEETFITAGPAVFDCGTSQLSDFDGNTYNTVLIGTQCWMAENLRTTHFSDGTLIQEGTNSSPYVSYRYTPNYDAINVSTYGYLYNHAAVIRGSVGGSQSNPSGVQGVCPVGWHVPSLAEWNQLFDTVRSKSQYWCNNSSYNIGKALSYTSGWMSSTYTCAIGNNQALNNATGFGAKPAGSAFYDNYDFYGLGRYAYYWCSDVNGDYSYNMTFEYDESEPWYSSAYSSRGMSVRCLQDRLPVVTTTQVNSVTYLTAVCGGNVTNSGASDIIDRGVCWSTEENPTVADSVTHDGTGLGIFTSNIFGLTEGMAYYVRAYATNVFGTSYGEVYRFVTLATPPVGDNIPCPGMPTVTDFDNNVYNTVKIGSQCWMKENLRTTHYADGTLIVMGTSTSTTTGYRYNPGNSATNVSTYGYLYNWPAVVKGVTGSVDKPSCLQGICPNGWHVPSNAEWTELTDYVSSQPYYRCDGYPNAIARAMASTDGWSSATGECNIGSYPSNNNSTGFSALPAGRYVYYDDYYFNTIGSNAYFWTATANNGDYYYYNSEYAYRRHLSYDKSSFVTYYGSSSYYEYQNYGLESCSEAYSVRCVRDTVYLPTVSTEALSDSSTNAAVCNGNVLYSGGTYVVDKGFCWSTSPNPTLLNANSGSVSMNYSSGTATESSVNVNSENSGQETGFMASYDFVPGQRSIQSNRYVNNEDYQNGVQTRSSNASIGLGSFTYTILGLQPGTTYYLRAYATNAVGTTYGNEITFSTLSVPAGDALPCPGTPTVTDYDGNVYNTVQIGNQCWMKENLRSEHFADGISIYLTYPSDTSTIYPYQYYPNGNVNYVSEYGYLYNIPAVLYGNVISSNNPSDLQGVCPNGWHVPSAAEWTQLINYVRYCKIFGITERMVIWIFLQYNW